MLSLAYYTTLFLNYCILTDVFITCNWIVCSIHSGIGAWRLWGAKAPTIFSEEGPPSQLLPPLVVCTGLMHVLYVLDYLFLSHSTCHIMTYHASCPIIPLHASIYTLTHSYRHNTHNYIPCQSLYTLRL